MEEQIYRIRKVANSPQVAVEGIGIAFEHRDEIVTLLGVYPSELAARQAYPQVQWRSMQGLAPLTGDVLFVGIGREES